MRLSEFDVPRRQVDAVTAAPALAGDVDSLATANVDDAKPSRALVSEHIAHQGRVLVAACEQLLEDGAGAWLSLHLRPARVCGPLINRGLLGVLPIMRRGRNPRSSKAFAVPPRV